MRRYAFIPGDYKQPVVLGWLTRSMGWVPDEYCGTEGILVRVGRGDTDAPTTPPPPDEEK